MTPTANTDEFLTTEEAASYLDLTVRSLHQMRCENRGPVSWREGRRLVYPRSGLDLYRENQRRKSLRGEGVISA